MGQIDRVNLDAVRMRELDNLLKRVDLLDSFNKSKLKCKFCGDIVTKENIYSLMGDSGHIKLVCQKIDCISQLMELLDSRRKKKVSK